MNSVEKQEVIDAVYNEYKRGTISELKRISNRLNDILSYMEKKYSGLPTDELSSSISKIESAIQKIDRTF